MTVGFLCSEASLFPPFSSCALEKEVTMCSLHLRRELGSTSSREVYLHNLFKIILHGDLSDLHLIIYSYQCGIMDIYFSFFLDIYF